MKKFTLSYSLLALLTAGLSFSGKGQNVAINTSGSAAYTGALLDMSNFNTNGTNGFLPPYVSLTANPNSLAPVVGVPSELSGLLVYNTSANLSGPGLYTWYYNSGIPANSTWVYLGSSGTVGGSGTLNYLARWTPNGTTLGIGVTQDNGTTVGINTAPVATQMLTTAQTNAANIAILGQNTAVSGNGAGIGVEGTTAQASGYGVYGQNASTSPGAIGVYGTANGAGSNGIGVKGNSTITGGTGVEGSNANPGASGGYGVQGLISGAGGGQQYGVYGSSTVTAGNGYGVEGTATGAGAINYGGYFTASNATNNYGVVVPNNGGFTGLYTLIPQSTLDVFGSLGTQISNALITANTTLDATYSTILANPSGGAFTITVPTAAPGNIRRVYTIVYAPTAVTANAVTITTPGGNIYINGTGYTSVSPFLMTGGSITIQSNGVNWYATNDWDGTTTAVSGAGTLNYLSRWTPNGSSLGNGITQDNGTEVGISTAPYCFCAGNGLLDVIGNAANPTALEGTTAQGGGYGVEGINTATAGAPIGVYGAANGVGSNGIGVEGNSLITGGIGVEGINANSGASGGTGVEGQISGAGGGQQYALYGLSTVTAGNGYGVSGSATGVGAAINYGGYFTASNGTNNYGVVVPNNGGFTGLYTSTPQSTLDVFGSEGHQISSVALTANTTLDATYSTILANPTGGAFTITLPTAGPTNIRRTYTVVYSPSAVTANAVTIQALAGSIYTGSTANASISLTNGSITLQSNGSNWYATNDWSGGAALSSITGTAPIFVTALPNPVVSLQGTNGGVFYGTGAGATVTAGGGTGTILYNSAANTPAWMPSGAAGSMLYNSAANTPAWLPAAANGDILTLAGGVPTWNTTASLVSANNGLTMNGINVQLGGANPLLANTNLNSGGFNLDFTGGGTFELGQSATSAGNLAFFDATNANTVSITSGATTASYSMTLPTTQGAANTVLTDNGAGVLTWTANAAGAANGLTVNGTNVQLGGANPLLANTSIISGGFNLAFTGTGAFQLGAASTSTGTLDFYNAGSVNAVGITAGATTAAYNMTLPLAQGAANTVLTNNGAGVLSWGAPALSGANNGITIVGGNAQLGGANALLANTNLNSGGFNLDFTGGGTFQLGQSATSAGNLAFFDATNANTVSITSGATTASYSMTLPTTQGAANTVLTNNGAGVLTWGVNVAGAANGLTMNGTNVQLGGANPLLANTSIISGGFNLAFTGTGAFQLGAASTSTGTLDFYNAGSVNAVGITAGATTAAYNMTLPLAQGAANTVLTNNGAGVLSWGAPALSGANNGITIVGGNAQLGGANALLANTNLNSGGFNLDFTGGGTFQLGQSATSAGNLAFFDATNANTVSITSGATTASYSMTLPTAQGAANTVLTDNGAGVLSWGAPAVSGANNGLTIVGGNTQLGGANPLLANTSIISGGFNLAFTGAGAFQLGAGSASTGTMQFLNSTNNNAIGISAGVTTAAYNMTLPTAQGAANTVLTDNGAGVLSWGAPAVSGANNGLTIVGGNTQLGGANPLLANTSIISGGFNLALTGTGNFGVGVAAPVNTMDVFGSVGHQISTAAITANTTLDGTYSTILANPTGGAFTVTLPTAAAGNIRRFYTIVYSPSAATANAVTIQALAGSIYTGATANASLSLTGGSITVQSNGINWYTTNDWTGSSITGAGTLNYLARWTPNGNTLGIGVTQDNGTTVGINTAPVATQMLTSAEATAANIAILGQNTAAAGAGAGIGVEGLTAQSAGYGVYGLNTATAAGAIGVYGLANGAGSTGIGVEGNSTVTGGTGVFGTNNNTGASGGYGVKGLVSGNGGGFQYGLYGASTVTAGDGFGVYGQATGAASINYGGYFTSSGATNNYGVVVPTGGGNSGFGTIAPVSTLDVAGSYGIGTTNIAPAAASTTALTNAYSTVIATPPAVAASYTLELPAATTSARRVYTIVYYGSGLGNIDITSPFGGNIYANGAAIATYALSQGSITFQSDGTNWQIVNTTSTTANGTFVGIKYITATTAATAFDAGTTSILVKVIGGGGAGSGGSTTGACNEQDVAGTGGGAGGYVEGFVNNLTGSSTFAVTIGAGGVANALCTTAGGNGGNTVLTIANPAVTFTGNGGVGGPANETNGADSYKIGGAGGTATSTAPAGTYITIQGATGGAGLSSNAGIHLECSGPGAGTTFGPGGSAISGRQVNEPGISAVAYGAGGGGAIIAQETTTEAGGAGYQGLVIIYEYN